MDNNDAKVIYDSGIIEKLKSGLQNVRIKSSDEEIKKDIDNLLQLLDNKDSDEIEFESLEDIIHNKMRNTRDKDLNVKLYMLYRKLQDGKISEEEALKSYEIYLSEEYDYRYL